VISRTKFLTLSWILGLGLFAFIIASTGKSRIWDSLKQLSWRSLALLFVLRLVYWLMRTYYWKIILNSYGERPSFANLFGARLAGHALSYLTPSSHFGGEAVRALARRALILKRRESGRHLEVQVMARPDVVKDYRLYIEQGEESW